MEEKKQRNNGMMFFCSDEEREAIKRAAAAMDMSFSDYARKMLLGKIKFDEGDGKGNG